MEVLAAVGLVGNIVQFIDFGGKLLARSAQLYRSGECALAENIDFETVTNDLVLLNKKLKDGATGTGDKALESLSLNKLKVKGKHQKWESIRKAIKSVRSKEDIERLEQRLSKFREEINLHIVVKLRYARFATCD
ncbi:hypothetical protein AOQ84DRAFT_302386 [Glonium stellatum]|uniref:Uncharacterized protein n=1 Tax=Glonium stellatum TaxID=574774 RepID=A0A8E2JNF5_9PEZI|nr:hypothetical protein AOQ84DRAFT_302386 [Glonium stellatum]